MVALDDGPLEWIPTWTCLDYTPNLVSGFDISRGRGSETETTDASTARVYLNDRDGLFDPDNTGSPFYGKIDGAQIALQCWDPVAEEWVRQYRGRIRRPTFEFNPATSAGVSILSNVQLECVDLFGYLARVKMVIGVFGDTPPTGSEGTVYYGSTPVDDRIAALLIEAGLTSNWYVVFTGNVDVQAMLYDAADDILTAIRDACDAEFPGIANCYTDRFGRFVFHGRFARFDPDSVAASAGSAAWDFQRWPAGDGAALTLDPTRAQIRPPLQWTRPSDDPELVNSAYCTPRGIAEADKAGQVFEDATSITKYGRCPWQAEGLIIEAGTTTGFTAEVECAKFAEHFVTNRADPRTRVSALTVKALDPADSRANATWGLLLRGDIADVIELEHGYPGGVGISESLYLEGIQKSVHALNRDYDMVEATFAVSPPDLTDVFST